MEVVVVLCGLLLVVLLLEDKIQDYFSGRKTAYDYTIHGEIPDIVGKPKDEGRRKLPSTTPEHQITNQSEDENKFDSRLFQQGFEVVIPQEGPVEVFDEHTDVEDEFSGMGLDFKEAGLAVGVAFEELATLDKFPGEDELEVVTVSGIDSFDGEDLAALLEESFDSSMERVSQLLDSVSHLETDTGSSTMRKIDFDSFNIDDFL